MFWLLMHSGLGAGAIVLLLIGMLQFRDGPFIRPHPAFWRIVLSASVVYQMILVFVLFQVRLIIPCGRYVKENSAALTWI